VTFAAIDSQAPATRRHIALKIARPELGVADLRRIQERWSHAAAARIRHEGLVSIDEPFLGAPPGMHAQSDAALLYLPMQLIEGDPLDKFAESIGWGRNALPCLRRPAEALDYLAREGLTHLDFKPSNVIVSPTGVGVVVDLGTLRSHDATPSIFTLGFVAPEAINADEGAEQTLARADAYSFAATVIWALTGAPPLRIADDAAWSERLVRLLPDHQSIHSTLLAGVARDPERRPSNLPAWLSKVEMSLTEASNRAAQSPPVVGRSDPPHLRTRVLIGIGVACLAAAGSIWLVEAQSANPQASNAPSARTDLHPAAVSSMKSPNQAHRSAATQPSTPALSRSVRHHRSLTPSATTRPVLTTAPPTGTPVTRPTTRPRKSPVSATASPLTVDVSATEEATPTGVVITSGEHLSTRASGRASSGYQGTTTTSDIAGPTTIAPDGTTTIYGEPAASKQDSTAECPSAPIGALIARIGTGQWFEVGASWSGVAQAAGELDLAFNDEPGDYTDNTGFYVVTITPSDQ
jgi:serine/threonine protein kinase